jgi:hypothetical protein
MRPITWQATGSALTLLGISWIEMLEAMENVTSCDDLRQLRGFKRPSTVRRARVHVAQIKKEVGLGR